MLTTRPPKPLKTCFTRTTIYFLGYAVVQLVEGLSYKPEVRGFDSRWCQWIFSDIMPSGLTIALGSIQPLTEYQE
jgi:hypothetical protein